MKFDDLFKTYPFQSDKERDVFADMFASYFSDLPANFYQNQFDLANKYPGTSYELWAEFLQHHPFDSWKSKQISIIASATTDKALSGEGMKDKDSLNLLRARTDILENENKEHKATIIVMPESLYFKDDDHK